VWLVMPAIVESQILDWQEFRPGFVELTAVKQYEGYNVYAVTVTDESVPEDDKRTLICDVPHAHEPAATAAVMNVLSQLITGRELDGTPSAHNVESIRRRAALTFIPDANPGGRARAPVEAWDGWAYTNDEFLRYAFGIDGATGERFPRPSRWHTDEYEVTRLGMVWEQIDDRTYVEPNRDPGSSLARLKRLLERRRRYDAWTSAHQTEFEGSDRNCMVLLPIIEDELPADVQAANTEWGEAVVAAWSAMGQRPVARPEPLGYTGEQRQCFVERWGDLYRTTPCVTFEVQNNSIATPPDTQRKLEEAAIWASIEWLLRAEG